MGILSATRDDDTLSAVKLDGESDTRLKAYRTIEGHDPAWYQRNPWVRTWASAPRQLASFTGGALLKLKVDDPIDFGSDVERIAVLWDGEVMAGPVVSVEQGNSIMVDIPAPMRGEVLEVWITGAIKVEVSVHPPSAKDAIRAELTEEAEDQGAMQDFVDGMGERYDKEQNRAERRMLYVLAAVVVVAVFVLPAVADKKISLG